MARTSEKKPRCAVCRHPERLAIDQALLRRTGVRKVAAIWDRPDARLSKSTVFKHFKDGHVSELLAKAADAAAVADGGALLARERENERRMNQLAEQHESKGDTRGAVIARRELGRIHEKIAALEREIQDREEVNILVLPQWQDLQRRILEALAPFPVARAAVADALAGGKALPALPAALEGSRDA